MRLIKGDIIVEDVTEEIVLKVLNYKKIGVHRFKAEIAEGVINKEVTNKAGQSWKNKEKRMLKEHVKEFGTAVKYRHLIAKKLGRSVISINNKLYTLKLLKKHKREVKNRTCKVWTKTEKDTTLKEINMTSPNTKNFKRVGRLLNRSMSSVYNKYRELKGITPVKKKDTDTVQIGSVKVPKKWSNAK